MIASDSRIPSPVFSPVSPWTRVTGATIPSEPTTVQDGFAPSSPPPPADPRALALPDAAASVPDASVTAHKGLRVALLAGLALAGIAGMSGCSAPPPPASAGVSQATAGAPIDVAQATRDTGYVKFSFDPMTTARLDIHRETETHTDSKGDSHTSDVALSPYGVDLGNGLFYDTSGNLTFNPYKALRGEPLHDAREVRIEGFLSGQDLERSADGTSLTGTLGLTARVQGDHLERPGLATDWSLSREGNTTVVHRGGFTTDVRITQEGNRTTIDRGLMTMKWTITREGNRITVDQGGLTIGTTVDLWQNRADMHRGWFSTEVSAGEGWMKIDRPGLGLNTTIHETPGSVSVESGLSTQTWTAR